MPRLTSVRHEIFDTIVLQTGDEPTSLKSLDGEDQPTDDAFTPKHVVVLPGHCGRKELLRIKINGDVGFSCHAGMLMTGYRRWEQMVLPDALNDVNDAVRAASERLLRDIRAGEETHQDIRAFSALLKALGEAAHCYSTVTHARFVDPTLMPPRSTIQAVASEGSVFTVMVSGYRSMVLGR